VLDHSLGSAGSFVLNHGIALALQLDELGEHQFETIEHTDDLRMGMRWYRTAQGRLQLLQAHPPISPARVVATDSERCQHGVNPVAQRDTLPEELLPFPDKTAGVFIDRVGNRHHRTHTWLPS
jgi:hypothetical protein